MDAFKEREWHRRLNRPESGKNELHIAHQLQCSATGFGQSSPPTSNWWIKTARHEDNEVEATKAGNSKTMSTSTLSVSIKQLLAELRSAGDDRTDEELLSNFLRSRDGDALAALVNRHASMVWGVCRRQLRNTQDAEDAFQATFLVLVRKASCVPGQAVPNWLYGVARQTAVRVLTTAAKRGHRETQVVNMPETAMREVQDADLQNVVDEELSRLPGHYRGVVILCDLEGMTRKEAARQLGIPEGSVASRLARARALLAKRLRQRDVVFSGSAAAALAAGSASSAPPALVAATIKAAGLVAAGSAVGVVSLKVAALTDGVVKVMFLSKLKAMFSVVLVLGILGTGATFRTYHAAMGQDDKKPVAEKPSEAMAEEEKEEAITAWGKEVNGLQIGVQLGKQRAYRVGENVTLILRLRNNGKAPVPYRYGDEYFLKNPPRITNENGKPVIIKGMSVFGHVLSKAVAPGKEVDLVQLQLDLRPATDRSKDAPWTIYGAGKFQIQYPVTGIVGEVRPDLAGMRLVTGKLELEVKEPEKLPAEKEPFTAWGKEVGGLQAGLGFKAGEKRVYRHGETATLVVRVRNVGKEEVKFEYLRPFFSENSPIVTDGEGKPVPLGEIFIQLVKRHIPVEVNLAAEKEIELYELKLEISSGTGLGIRKFPTIFGTGKFQFQYEKVLGNTSSGSIKLDPVLSKLATGKLELEVKEAPAEKPKVLTPKEAIKIAGDSELTKKFNATKPAVEFKVEFVTKAIQVKASGEKDSAWAHGHSPDDVCLGLLVPNTPGAAIDLVKRDHIRFVATLTAKVISQLNKVGITDLEKHFKGKTVRVAGPISRHAYDGEGSPNEVEVVLDDMSQLEVVK